MENVMRFLIILRIIIVIIFKVTNFLLLVLLRLNFYFEADRVLGFIYLFLLMIRIVFIY
jgi:hypothetical protein